MAKLKSHFSIDFIFKKQKICVEVLAQLADRSLSTQEELGSNPLISNFLEQLYCEMTKWLKLWKIGLELAIKNECNATTRYYLVTSLLSSRAICGETQGTIFNKGQ